MGSPSEIFNLTFGVATDMNEKGVVYEHNLFWWVIYPQTSRDREESLVIPNQEFTKYIAALFSLLSTVTYTGVY